MWRCLRGVGKPQQSCAQGTSPLLSLLCYNICICTHSFDREQSKRPCFTNTFSWGFLMGQAALILERDTTDCLARSTRPIHTSASWRSTLVQEWRSNSYWYQHNYSFVLSYNVTSENIIRFIFLQFILSSCGCMTQRMCFQIVLFKITFDSSFLYGSVNQQDA